MRTALLAVAIAIALAGCSHATGPAGGGGGGGTVPVTLTFHDTPSAGVVVTSFEASVTGVTLQPGNVPLLASPGQTVEFTQLEANSVLLSTTKVNSGTYNSLTITYANPQFTILNNTGAALTIGGKTCNAGQSCLVAPTVSGKLTNTISTSPFPITLGTSSQALVEVDVNLNNIVQQDLSVDFSASGAVTANVQQVSSSPVVIGSLAVSGAIKSVGTNQFTLTASTGQTIQNISVTSSTQFSQFNQTSRKSSCTANNFTCLAAGQIVDVELQILGTGAFQAAEVDFDDAASTQQVSGTIVALGSGSPPTSFQMVVQNTVPALTSLPVGTPVTVNVGTGATFLVNNGLFVLPTGGFSFASSADFLVGQEVEARVSGTVAAGPPPSFTADRFALGQTQFNGTIFSISSPNFFVNFTNLPTLFTSPITQIQVITTTQTQFQTQSTGSFTDLSSLVSVPGGISVGGFLFNSTNPNAPNIFAVTARGKVPGT